MSEPQTPPAAGDGLTAQPAAVRPRGHRLRSEASLPLDLLLLPVIRAALRGIVLITAGPGGGKTTALRHLRAVLPPDVRVGFFDADQSREAHQAAASRLVMLTTSESAPSGQFLDVFALNPWTLDDCLEYLAASHPGQCASVLSRLSRDQSFSVSGGSPQLLSVVMDAMAGEPLLDSSREILRQHIQRIIPPGSELNRFMIEGPSSAPLSPDQRRWWRHKGIQRICTADWIAGQLADGSIPSQLENMDEAAPLIPEIAAAVKQRPAAINVLQRLLRRDKRSPAAAMAASILVSADPNWRPANGRGLNLRQADLPGARWAGVDLTGAVLTEAYFAGADLSGAKLNGANAESANLSGANLHNARLNKARLVSANLFSADLSGASGSNADFSRANLEAANLGHAVFRSAIFENTNFAGARAEWADFSDARFREVTFDQAEFTGAKFIKADFHKVQLSCASWVGACFTTAILVACDLEGLELPAADFDGADLTSSLLTGSRIPGGHFRGANLTQTGLAEIDWENADLRGANLTNASFHLGSTRSGLVGSTIPMEGSRTGFYTDDFNEQLFKSPEEIRKACLCGANLLGAKVLRADFYLVDLRRAIYSKTQARHFARSGAILRSASE